MTETIKVTAQGVLVPRPLIRAWGDIQEVEVEQRSDAIILKPVGQPAAELHERIVREMKAAGLVEDLPWTPPPAVSAPERARLAKALSQGQPLSEIIIEERQERA